MTEHASTDGANRALPPSVIRDGDAVAILPPTTKNAGRASDNWLAVDNYTGGGGVVDQSGALLGQTNAEIAEYWTNTFNRRVVSLTKAQNKPVQNLSPVDPATLPAGVAPDPDLPNKFKGVDTPPAGKDATGVAVGVAEGGKGVLVSGTIKSAGASSVTVNGDGSIAARGVPDEAGARAAKLSAGKAVDASGVTGTGAQIIDAGADVIRIEKFGYMEGEIIDGGGNDVVSLDFGVRVTSVHKGVNMGAQDVLAVTGTRAHGAGSIDVSEAVVRNFEILDLTAAGKQELTIKTTAFSGVAGQNIKAGAGDGDMVVFADLSGKAADADSVNATTEWFLADGVLTYWSADANDGRGEARQVTLV